MSCRFPKFSKVAFLAAVSVLLLCQRAHATVIKFDAGLFSGDATLFTYSGVSTVDGFTLPVGSGYHKVAALTGGNHVVAFNPYAVSPSEFYWVGADDFTLDSLIIAGAWGNQTLTMNGYNDGTLLFSEPLAVTPDPTIFAPSWGMIDQLEITIDPSGYTDLGLGGGGQHWSTFGPVG